MLVIFSRFNLLISVVFRFCLLMFFISLVVVYCYDLLVSVFLFLSMIFILFVTFYCYD
jgi:hypothetical protein